MDCYGDNNNDGYDQDDITVVIMITMLCEEYITLLFYTHSLLAYTMARVKKESIVK